jgi:hypothetical protein
MVRNSFSGIIGSEELDVLLTRRARRPAHNFGIMKQWQMYVGNQNSHQAAACTALFGILIFRVQQCKVREQALTPATIPSHLPWLLFPLKAPALPTWGVWRRL